MTVDLIRGDCLEVMATLAENSIDTIITDPPYGLEFMGKDWDHGIPGIPFWTAALRVAKPGATLMAFGGTRTHHRLMCAIEDAGWELRDVMMWVYGSGFPKSHDISKAIDKAAGVEMESRGHFQFTQADEATTPGAFRTNEERSNPGCRRLPPATPAAELWDGWGTALKPAWEPIIIAQKPRDGTFANNALTWGVAGLNIDGGRVAGTWTTWRRKDGTICPQKGYSPPHPMDRDTEKPDSASRNPEHAQGRWPANLVHDGSDEVTSCLPVTKTNGYRKNSSTQSGSAFHNNSGAGERGHNDSGSAARFFKTCPITDGDVAAQRLFYCAKASRAERNAGCEEMEGIDGSEHTNRKPGSRGLKNPRSKGGWSGVSQNHHPCVKPLALMRYLAKLTKTPTGGIVLDPFMGSGTTGMAAVYEGRSFIGIELEPEYFEIATARVQHAIDGADVPQQMKMGAL